VNKNSIVSGREDLKIDIYADGPTLEEIKTFNSNQICGYTFNPTLFRKLDVKDYLGHCRRVIQACGKFPVSLEVIADDFDGMVRQARVLGDLGKNVYVKIPITLTSGKTTLPVIETLLKDDLKLNITAVFTKGQIEHILPAVRASDTIISVFAGRLFDIGTDAVSATREIADLVHGESDCKVLWASPRMVYDLQNACMAKCDIITMQPELIRKLSLFEKSAADYSLDTVKMFYEDAVISGYKL